MFPSAKNTQACIVSERHDSALDGGTAFGSNCLNRGVIRNRVNFPGNVNERYRECDLTDSGRVMGIFKYKCRLFDNIFIRSRHTEAQKRNS